MPVYSALHNLAQDIRVGLGDIRKSRLAGAELGLRQSERELARTLTLGRERRESTLFGLKERGLKLSLEEAQRKEILAKREFEEGAKPLNIRMFAQGVDSSRTLTSIISGAPMFEEITGAKLTETGEFVRDGEMVTIAEARTEPFKSAFESIIRARVLAEPGGTVSALERKEGVDTQKLAEQKAELEAKPMKALEGQMQNLLNAKQSLSFFKKETPAIDAQIKLVEDKMKHQRALELKGVTGKLPVHEAKIKTLQEANPGLTKRDATGIILGTQKIVQSPVTNERFIVDVITGKEKPLITTDIKPKPTEVPAPTTTIWGLSGLATGPVSAALAGVSVVSGAVGGPIAKRTARARQFVTSAQNELIRALSINPRFPVGEINRIRKEVNLSPQIFDNPKLFRQRAIAIDEHLRIRLSNEQKASEDTTLPASARRDAKQSANDIENFLNVLGVPQSVQSIDEARALPVGTQFLDPNKILRVR